MLFIKKPFKNLVTLSVSAILIELSRLFKVSFIVGSSFSFFSAVSIVAPMIGVFAGTLSSLTLTFALSLIKWFVVGGSLISLTGYHIPHFFASFYWNTQNKLFRVLIPLLCMFLFIAHPVGLVSFAYSLLWLIPITIGLSDTKNIMLTTLGSTFTAHAIGSVIWIYSTPMTSAAWIALIPIALMERLVFASAMALTYYAVSIAKRYSQAKLKTSKELVSSIN